MKKPQWLFAGIAFLLTIGLYAITQDRIFGNHTKPVATEEHAPHDDVNIESILLQAKQKLTNNQATHVNFLESSVSRGDVLNQKIHVYHQLAEFWKDSARIFEPYAWYTSEAARLENSEKSLTFAAHLFLENLKGEPNHEIKHWKALQAKDLFERSLKLNPANDSALVGLGAVYLYGDISNNPMTGIMKIREVAERDSTHVYAQMTLANASVISGQFDKAIERFETVVRHDASNLEAILSLADIHERKKQNKEAVKWYRKSLPLIKIEGLKQAVEKRISELSN